MLLNGLKLLSIPMSHIFASDLNPDFTYIANDGDHPHFKKKVVKVALGKILVPFCKLEPEIMSIKTVVGAMLDLGVSKVFLSTRTLKVLWKTDLKKLKKPKNKKKEKKKPN